MSIEEVLAMHTKEQSVEAAGYKGRGLVDRDCERLFIKIAFIEQFFNNLGYDVVLRETRPRDENEK